MRVPKQRPTVRGTDGPPACRRVVFGSSVPPFTVKGEDSQQEKGNGAGSSSSCIAFVSRVKSSGIGKEMRRGIEKHDVNAITELSTTSTLLLMTPGCGEKRDG